ncbi:MAG: hypothetical protein KBG28_24375 [Kofleriaceae bacterium]|jgi:hypothetical protein|nr:hypothetical protein [Kofleriaceae bacterium]MBP6839296.1 hypothetical protein [Kofleriaceae bacterium]MBP9207127.1 hypothetical protein [Kofleriaceae bacterium]
MNLLKKTLPLAFGVVVGLYAVAEFYLPHHVVPEITTEIKDIAALLGAAAFILGGLNLIQVTAPKIRRRERDWQYKIVMLVSAAVMFAVGIVGAVVKPGKPASYGSYAVTADPSAPATSAVIQVDASSDVMVQVGAVQRPALGADGKPARIEVAPGTVGVKLYRRVAGYAEYAVEVPVAAGQVARVTADLPMLWGKEGRVYVWFYDHVFAPCNATMFALLAFFVASAAFRAFRARNVEAALLLGSAIIILLARAPIGRVLSESVPALGQWILDVPNNGSRRAIMMGAAIGAISTSLRIILGLERSHLGND